MTKISRDRIKKRGFKRFLKSFQYSVEGLTYAYQYEQSMLIHFIASVVAVCLGLWLDIERIEWIMITLAIVIILIVELFNTAIEAVVDLVTLDVHPLAKIAKDCGSAATLVSVTIAVVVCLYVFAPYILDKF